MKKLDFKTISALWNPFRKHSERYAPRELLDDANSELQFLREQCESLAQQIAEQQIFHSTEIAQMRKMLGAKSMKKIGKQFAKMARSEAEGYARESIDEKWDGLRKHLESQVKFWKRFAFSFVAAAGVCAGSAVYLWSRL